MHTILLVEDNIEIQTANKELLEDYGYTVSLAMNLAEARSHISKSIPDLIVLDIMLPDGSGLDFLRELRSENSGIPVLLLTVLSETNDEIKGIKEGGNDYVAKPYDNDILVVRIENLLRQADWVDEQIKAATLKANEGAPDIFEYGPLVINYVTQRVSLGGADVNLTPREFMLLVYFTNNMDKQLTSKEIYELVWGQDALSNSIDTVRVRIKELRRKLKMDDETSIVIKTVQRKYYICRKTEAKL